MSVWILSDNKTSLLLGMTIACFNRCLPRADRKVFEAVATNNERSRLRKLDEFREE